MFIDYFMQERTINYQFSSRSTGLGGCLLHPVPPGFRHLTIRSSATPRETRSSSPPCPPVFLPQPAAVSSHPAISPGGLRIFLNLPSHHFSYRRLVAFSGSPFSCLGGSILVGLPGGSVPGLPGSGSGCII